MATAPKFEIEEFETMDPAALAAEQADISDICLEDRTHKPSKGIMVGVALSVLGWVGVAALLVR